MTVHTIGHSTRSIESFIALLEQSGIRLLVDVRRVAGSRLHPHFGREALDASLAGRNIAYRHAPELGGRRAPRDGSPNTAWENAGFRGYADYMASSDFREGLDRLVQDAGRTAVAIMCAEAVPWRCHRNLLSDALVMRGLRVAHILDADQIREHTVHPAARLRAGTLEYPGDGPQQELL